MSASTAVAPISVSSALSPFGSIGSSATLKFACAPTSSLRSGATLMITALVSRWGPGRPLLEHFEALLDDRQGLHEVALQTHKDVRGVLVGSAHRLFGLVLRLVEELLRLRLRLSQDGLILQEQRRLLLSRADDLLS